MGRLYIEEESSSEGGLAVVYIIILIILFPIGVIYLLYKSITSITRFCHEVKDRKYKKAIQSSEATNCTVDAMDSIAYAKGNGWLTEEDFEKIKSKRVKTLKKL